MESTDADQTELGKAVKAEMKIQLVELRLYFCPFISYQFWMMKQV